eukprot:Platyproteum_vivax@DN931_c0_g1_i2.p1
MNETDSWTTETVDLEDKGNKTSKVDSAGLSEDTNNNKEEDTNTVFNPFANVDWGNSSEVNVGDEGELWNDADVFQTGGFSKSQSGLTHTEAVPTYNTDAVPTYNVELSPDIQHMGLFEEPTDFVSTQFIDVVPTEENKSDGSDGRVSDLLEDDAVSREVWAAVSANEGLQFVEEAQTDSAAPEEIASSSLDVVAAKTESPQALEVASENAAAANTTPLVPMSDVVFTEVFAGNSAWDDLEDWHEEAVAEETAETGDAWWPQTATSMTIDKDDTQEFKEDTEIVDVYLPPTVTETKTSVQEEEWQPDEEIAVPIVVAQTEAVYAAVVETPHATIETPPSIVETPHSIDLPKPDKAPDKASDKAPDKASSAGEFSEANSEAEFLDAEEEDAMAHKFETKEETRQDGTQRQETLETDWGDWGDFESAQLEAAPDTAEDLKKLWRTLCENEKHAERCPAASSAAPPFTNDKQWTLDTQITAHLCGLTSALADPADNSPLPDVDLFKDMFVWEESMLRAAYYDELSVVMRTNFSVAPPLAKKPPPLIGATSKIADDDLSILMQSSSQTATPAPVQDSELNKAFQNALKAACKL